MPNAITTLKKTLREQGLISPERKAKAPKPAKPAKPR